MDFVVKIHVLHIVLTAWIIHNQGRYMQIYSCFLHVQCAQNSTFIRSLALHKHDKSEICFLSFEIWHTEIGWILSSLRMENQTKVQDFVWHFWKKSASLANTIPCQTIPPQIMGCGLVSIDCNAWQCTPRLFSARSGSNIQPISVCHISNEHDEGKQIFDMPLSYDRMNLL